MLRMLAVFGLLGLMGPVRAQDDARIWIERAIAAHGGKEKLAAVKVVQTQTRGTISIGDKEAPFTARTTAQPPTRLRNFLECEIDGKKQTVVQIVDGDKVMLRLDGREQAVGDRVLTEMKELQYAERVNTLLPLLEDRSIALSVVGTGEVGGRTTVAIRVASRGRRDIVLHFDKSAALMLRAERRVLDPATGREVPQEELYSDFKDVQGLKKPMRVTVLRDGKLYMKAEVEDVQFLDKIDDEVFRKP